MIRAVLDTNVLVSGILGLEHSSKPSAEIFRRWEVGAFGLVTSSHILEELVRTLGNLYFSTRISPTEAAQATLTIQRQAEIADTTDQVRTTATHPEDDFILAAAVSAQVDYLVTGDRQLLALHGIRGIEIVSPSQFLDILDASLPPPRDDAPSGRGGMTNSR